MPFANLLEFLVRRVVRLAMPYLVAGACAVASAATDEPAEVARLQAGGQSALALQRADAFLVGHPRDPQMRFLKAVILGESSRRGEAVALLEKLTQDFPDLPEPYNNLAVLHAAAGDYLKARAELEQALRLNPRYATAHENLGDVQAALAREAYEAALRLEPARGGVSSKVVLLRQLLPAARTDLSSAPASAPVSGPGALPR